VKELEGERNVPSSAEEGWLRDQENGAQHNSSRKRGGADEVQ
jgi:hypothetical protein